MHHLWRTNVTIPAQLMDYKSLSAQKLVLEIIQTNAAGAWEEFSRRYDPGIVCTINRRAARWGEYSVDIRHDLYQDVYLKFIEKDFRTFRLMIESTPEEKYGPYLNVVAAHVVDDHFKSRKADKRGSGKAAANLSDLEGLIPSRGYGSVSEMERDLLKKEIVQAMAAMKISEQDQTIFKLHYFQGLTAEEIAALPTMKLTVKGVESALKRVRDKLREYFENGKGFAA